MTYTLRKLAEAATPGPWNNTLKGNGFTSIGGKTLIARVYSENYGDVQGEEANATYIAAANPTAILALLNEHEAALAAKDKRIAELEEALKPKLSDEMLQELDEWAEHISESDDNEIGGIEAGSALSMLLKWHRHAATLIKEQKHE